MFPTIADLVNYLFNIHIVLPVQTLGFFMALSFVLSYWVFRSEFKRKEKEGKIHAFTRMSIVGGPASPIELLLNGLLGFLFGYKIIGAVLDYRAFLYDPRNFLLSLHGNLICGLIAGTGFAGWIYFDRRKARRPAPEVMEQTVHPYQLMMKIVFSVAFWGFIGAKLFDTAEHLNSLEYDPIGTLFSFSGFSYYGGLIFGALAYLYIGYTRGMKLSHLADIGSPGMMLAYGIGRIGCQLSGDGDWGIVNTKPAPAWLPEWAWSSRFPHNIIRAGEPIKTCIGDFCTELTKGVYPTSLYEAFTCIMLFLLMWAFRKHIHAAGLMFYIYLVLNGIERFCIETIRTNIKYHFGGIAFTQAEVVSAMMIAGGLTGIGYLLWKTFKNEGRGALKNI
jgi:phosphatidylglycerol:prolipoprotein diacylglycerol transferase